MLRERNATNHLRTKTVGRSEAGFPYNPTSYVPFEITLYTSFTTIPLATPLRHSPHNPRCISVGIHRRNVFRKFPGLHGAWLSYSVCEQLYFISHLVVQFTNYNIANTTHTPCTLGCSPHTSSMYTLMYLYSHHTHVHISRAQVLNQQMSHFLKSDVHVGTAHSLHSLTSHHHP